MGSKSTKSVRHIPRAVHAVRILLQPQHRGPLLAAAVVGVALAGFLYAWQRWGEPSLNSPEYAVTHEQIHVTPQPAWIHADVKAEVLRTADATRLNLRDPRLVEELAAVFALHPWVAEVVRVQKRYPARVDVELKYRRPVAAVEVSSQSEAGLLFVDAAGVLLPSADFAQGQAKD
jgi:cell division septal protein FtsQ